MPTTVSIVLLASHGGTALARTLDSIERQSPDLVSAEVVIAARATTPREREGIGALAAPRGARLQAFLTATTGAVANACLAGATGRHAIVLDEGDELPDGFLAAGAAALTSGTPVAAVRYTWAAGFHDIETVTPTALHLEAALATPQLAPPVFLFRRDDWTRVGGFDEAVPALAEYDLLLRLLEGGRGVRVDCPPLRRRISRSSRTRQELESSAHLAALGLVLAKHRAVLERDPAPFLVERERESASLIARHRALVARRDEAVVAITDARAEALTLAGFLRGHGRAGVDWGELRETSPISRDWGYDRGTPLDRVYIERFVADHASDIRGRVLEVQENDLTRRFGRPSVTHSDIVDIDPANVRATVIADLRHASALPDESYDCIILTQTLHVIDDMAAVLRECWRTLKPGGTLLATFPTASRVCVEYGRDGDFWRVTEAGARRLCASVFGDACVSTTSFGNVLTTTAFLEGAAAHELSPAEFEQADPAYPTVIGVRAVRAGASTAQEERRAAGRDMARGRAAVLLYHRVAAVDHDLHGLAMPPELFAAQMEFIASRYLPLPLAEILDAGAQRRLPHGAVAVTFDDGYKDNRTTAAPILSKHGIPAAFFVPTGILDRAQEFWWDTLARVLGADRGAHDDVYRRIVRGTAEEIERAIDELCASRGTGRGDSQVMTRQELLNLAASPTHTIGAHGVHHLYLPAQSDSARHDELFRSRRALEDLLGRNVRWLAYPFGAYDQVTCDAARVAGYDGGLTCDARALGEGEDPYRIPRIEVRCRTTDEFASLLSGLLE